MCVGLAQREVEGCWCICTTYCLVMSSHTHTTYIPTNRIPPLPTHKTNNRTTNDALDAELVADASHECLLRLAVVVTGFDKAEPKAARTLYSACGKSK